MNSLARLGEAVGEYSSHGQGEQENPTQVDQDGENDDEDSMETCDTNSETSDSKPVHVFFDIQTTGLSIYNDHVTDIRAKVVGAPSSQLSSPSFASLVHTPRNISAGTYIHLEIITQHIYMFVTCSVKEDRNKCCTALTQVFQESLNWIHQVIQQLEEERGLNSYHPGTQFIQCIVTEFELYS